MIEQLAIDFDRTYPDRVKLRDLEMKVVIGGKVLWRHNCTPSGPLVGTTMASPMPMELHFCGWGDYKDCLNKKEIVVAWCGTQLQGNLVYPKLMDFITCPECVRNYFELEAEGSGEIFKERTDFETQEPVKDDTE